MSGKLRIAAKRVQIVEIEETLQAAAAEQTVFQPITSFED